eukprot:TRINITY_DN21666_c0_g1_i1.p2 TRINITY_DN21666_c0_g1~~TRINITY_DN21666_c0_g1_i1.p2  ORF type:complete len:228 (+),score=67.27 TRINITY_DN21666_c0_g1_i1:78-761(+)
MAEAAAATREAAPPLLPSPKSGSGLPAAAPAVAGAPARAASSLRGSAAACAQSDRASVRSQRSLRSRRSEACSLPSSLQYPEGSITSSRALAQLQAMEEELAAERRKRLLAENRIRQLVGVGKVTRRPDAQLTAQNLSKAAHTGPSPQPGAFFLPPAKSPASADADPLENEGRRGGKPRRMPPVYKGGIAPCRHAPRRHKVADHDVWIHNQRKASNELRFLFRDNWG